MRKCVACDSTTTYIDKRGYEHWNHHDGDTYCRSCYNRYINNPVYNPIEYPKTTRIKFKDKRIHLKEEIRKGVCRLCGAIKGIDCVRTQIHHIKYDDSDPLANTIELCSSCHANIHNERRGRNRK